MPKEKIATAKEKMQKTSKVEYNSFFSLLFSLAFALIFLSAPLFSVNICPLDKNPTEITIEHSRHPINLPIGVLDNTIDVTISLVAVNRETGEKTPLANKEILLDLTIGSKFINKIGNDFALSDTQTPFPINTSENGTIHFTIYTQKPLLNDSVNPKKISYSITASFTPKPKDPLMGSTKTERYVPGVFPIISMGACLPLFLVIGLLISAMFAAGKNPFGLFDFSRVAFKAPGAPRGKMTTRVKGTLLSILATAAHTGTTVVMKSLSHKYVIKPVGEAMIKSAETLAKMAKSEKKGVGAAFVKFIAGGTSKALKFSGRVAMTGTSRRLTQQEMKMLEDAKQASGQKAISEKEAEKILLGKEGSGQVIKGPLGEFRIVEALPTRTAFRSALTTFNKALGNAIASYGVRPWSLSYAYPPQINRPSEEKMSEEEIESTKKKNKEVYGIELVDTEDIDVYGLTDSGKDKILESLGFTKGGLMGLLSNLAEKLKTAEKREDVKDEIKSVTKALTEKMSSIYNTPKENSKLNKMIKQLSETNMRDLKNNVKSIYAEEKQNLRNRISYSGALVKIDKKDLIYSDVLNGPTYYKNYGLDEMKARAGEFSLLAQAHGMSFDEIRTAFETENPKLIKKIFEQARKNPDAFTAFNYITKNAQMGLVMRFLDKMEFKDEKGKIITSPDKKMDAFLKTDYGRIENNEILTKAVIDTKMTEWGANLPSNLKNAHRILYGTEVSMETANVAVLGIVNDGMRMQQERINDAETELNRIKEENLGATPGSLGEYKIKKQEKVVEKLKSDLDTIEKGVSEIVNDIDLLKTMKDMHDYGVANGMANISAPDQISLQNIESIKNASAILDSTDSANRVNSANLYTERKIDDLTLHISNLTNSLPPIPYQLSEIDKRIVGTIKNFDSWKSGYEIIPSNSVKEISEKDSGLQLSILGKQIESTIRYIEYERKQNPIESKEEEERYNTYITELTKINGEINDAKARINGEMKTHINNNRDNPFASIIDGIGFNNFDERGVDPEVLRRELIANKTNDANSIVYYYTEERKYQDEKKNDEETWTAKFYGLDKRKKVVNVRIEQKK